MLAMIKQTKEHRDHSENSNSSEQKCAGISHGEDCWIQTLEIQRS